ncbi:hypothetical protein FQN54_005676 [Arachnomyces sp. PD_36]|nr:hypothetical protein FQN54_005676 [Arachnomyces sp. PD_36]
MGSRIQETVDQRVREGKFSLETGKALKRKFEVTDKLTGLYKRFSKSPESRFGKDDLREVDIKLIPWNIQTSAGQPKFFKPFNLEGYHVPEYHLHKLLDDREYCHSGLLRLQNCMSESSDIETDSDLLISSGWNGEKYNRELLRERGDVDNLGHRYEWSSNRMFARDDAPHTIILSTHMCDEPERILRSELMILLAIITGRGALGRNLDHDIVPVLLISLRHHHFRVIEAYYDGSNVVVRYSNPVHLKLNDSCKQQQQAARQIIRWCVAEPVGDTRKFSSLQSSR